MEAIHRVVTEGHKNLKRHNGCNAFSHQNVN